MNISVVTVSASRGYDLSFSVPSGIIFGGAILTKIYVSVFVFDAGYFQLKKKILILEGITKSFTGSQTTTVPTNIDLTQNIMIIGIKSIYFHDSFPLEFSFSYDTTDINFPINSLYNEVQYVWISVKSCAPGTYLDRVNFKCKD